jgi:hypothetical protein
MAITSDAIIKKRAVHPAGSAAFSLSLIEKSKLKESRPWLPDRSQRR